MYIYIPGIQTMDVQGFHVPKDEVLMGLKKKILRWQFDVKEIHCPCQKSTRPSIDTRESQLLDHGAK